MRARTVLLLALLGSVTLAGVAASAPPPERFCGLCTEHFDEIAAEEDLGVTAEESSLSVRVFANGSTRWTERVVLESTDSGAIDADRTQLKRVARSARESRWILVDDPGSLDVAFDGRNLTATYWVADAASERVGGVVLFEGFHARPRWGTTMEADRVTVTGPAGTSIANRVPDARVAGRTAEWSRTEGEYVSPGEGTYVAFAPSGGLGGTVAGTLAVGTAAGPPLFEDAVAVGGPPSVAVLLLAGTVRALRRRPRDYEIRGCALSKVAVAASAVLSLAVVASVAFGATTLGVLGFGALPLAVVGSLSTADRRVTAAAALLLPTSTVLTALTFAPVSGFGIGFHTLVYSVVVALTTGPVLLGYAGIALLRRRSPS